MNFLEQVASYYIAKAKAGEIDLADYTFVLPNKRSAMFMRKYLKNMFDGEGFMPKLSTITAFTQEFCDRPLGSNTELLFILYKSYLKVLERRGASNSNPDFDSFIFWGNVTLNDFNDVDSYAVDASKLFKNLVDLKEIESNYLTHEQIEAARMLGVKRPLKEDVENFWKHMPSNPETAKMSGEKFLSLWEILGDLYEQFNKDLEREGLAYSGLQSRIACQKAKQLGRDDFGHRRFAFIGFYVLSTTRQLMLKRLEKIGVADFFWDTASPLLNQTESHAGDQILPLSDELKAPADFKLEPITTEPEVCIYPVSSLVGQAKACAQVLDKWKEQDQTATGAITTGVVLPSDSLLMPMLYSVSKGYFPVNVAMKTPFSTTPLSTLMSSILFMQERARFVRGVRKFYYVDVLEILSNPYIASSLTTAVNNLKSKIVKEHIFNVGADEVMQEFPELSFIFASVDPKNMLDVQAYVMRLLDELEKYNVEKKMLQAYAQSTQEALALAVKHGVNMREHTIFTLIRKLVASKELHYSGNPVWGLQLMNMPDARVLDFDNLAILSLNEGILPSKGHRPSLVPPNLRSGYGMPTRDDEDKAMAYQFFRLVSRAKRLALFYDNRTPDLSKGEKSRYITQLQIMLKKAPAVRDTMLGYESRDIEPIQIEKTESVLRELDNFKAGGSRNFSASAFKTYIKCPLKFYLEYVKGLKIEDFDPEYMDAASYGTVLHEVAEIFYKDFEKELDEKNYPTKCDHFRSYIDADCIKAKLNDNGLDKRLATLALKSMCKYYGEKYLDKLDQIPGEGRVLARLMAKYVRNMLRCECGDIQPSKEDDNNSVPFIFHSGEDDGGAKVHHWQVNDTHCINFRMSIDRIDWLNDDGSEMRFIDYKTGSDEIAANSFDELFIDHDRGAIFQLLLYCMAYADIKRLPGTRIKPLVYRFKDMAKNGIKSLTIENKSIKDYRQNIIIDNKEIRLVDAFRERFANMLDMIFSPDIPFTQTPEYDNCKYCAFLQICGRPDKS